MSIFLALLLAAADPRLVPVGTGWARNSVNAVVFRHNAIVSHGSTQFIAYYDADEVLVLGKRRLGTSRWQLRRTPYRGHAADAHDSISIMVDGDGYLHVSWDQHNRPLRYCRGVTPGSLRLGAEIAMIGRNESSVTYPEFYRLPNGNLLFFYRDGGAANGSVVLNQYDVATRRWTRLYDRLIDGEGARSAYWQVAVGADGSVHLAWIWRDALDIASNRDLCYAKSDDGGRTWSRSDGRPYTLPITDATAEVAVHIRRGSSLMNQTSLAVDDEGRAYIAGYWADRESGVPAYRVVTRDASGWQTATLPSRTAPFSVSGSGTKRLPMSRPQIVTWRTAGKQQVALVFRDEERGSRVSVAMTDDLRSGRWRVEDLTRFPVGAWEPSYDTELWRRRGELHLFVERVEQEDDEALSSLAPQPVYVLQWKP